MNYLAQCVVYPSGSVVENDGGINIPARASFGSDGFL